MAAHVHAVQGKVTCQFVDVAVCFNGHIHNTYYTGYENYHCDHRCPVAGVEGASVITNVPIVEDSNCIRLLLKNFSFDILQVFPYICCTPTSLPGVLLDYISVSYE